MRRVGLNALTCWAAWRRASRSERRLMKLQGSMSAFLFGLKDIRGRARDGSHARAARRKLKAR